MFMNNKFKQIFKIILQKMNLLSFITYCYNFKRFFSLLLKFYFFNGLLTFFSNHFIQVIYLKNIRKIKIDELSFILSSKKKITIKIQEYMNFNMLGIKGDYNGL